MTTSRDIVCITMWAKKFPKRDKFQADGMSSWWPQDSALAFYFNLQVLDGQDGVRELISVTFRFYQQTQFVWLHRSKNSMPNNLKKGFYFLRQFNFTVFFFFAHWRHLKKRSLSIIYYITDGNPLVATPENCNLPINCNFFLQPNQAYYKGGQLVQLFRSASAQLL